MTETTSQSLILVVEDDPNMLQIITILLEDEGYLTLEADSGEAALSLLQSNRPDLIVSDVMMPGMSGYDLFEEIRKHTEWGQIPFIFLTAKGQRADVRRGMGLGADDYLTKPFEPGELLAAVQVRLARSAELNSLGTIEQIAPKPQVLPSGLRAASARVRFENGETVTVPLANLEILT